MSNGGRQTKVIERVIQTDTRGELEANIRVFKRAGWTIGKVITGKEAERVGGGKPFAVIATKRVPIERSERAELLDVPSDDTGLPRRGVQQLVTDPKILEELGFDRPVKQEVAQERLEQLRLQEERQRQQEIKRQQKAEEEIPLSRVQGLNYSPVPGSRFTIDNVIYEVTERGTLRGIASAERKEVLDRRNRFDQISLEDDNQVFEGGFTPVGGGEGISRVQIRQREQQIQEKQETGPVEQFRGFTELATLEPLGRTRVGVLARSVFTPFIATGAREFFSAFGPDILVESASRSQEFRSGLVIGAATAIPELTRTPETVGLIIKEPRQSARFVLKEFSQRPERFLGEQLGAGAVFTGLGKGISGLRVRQPTIRTFQVGQIEELPSGLSRIESKAIVGVKGTFGEKLIPIRSTVITQRPKIPDVGLSRIGEARSIVEIGKQRQPFIGSGKFQVGRGEMALRSPEISTIQKGFVGRGVFNLGEVSGGKITKVTFRPRFAEAELKVSPQRTEFALKGASFDESRFLFDVGDQKAIRSISFSQRSGDLERVFSFGESIDSGRTFAGKGFFKQKTPPERITVFEEPKGRFQFSPIVDETPKPIKTRKGPSRPGLKSTQIDPKVLGEITSRPFIQAGAEFIVQSRRTLPASFKIPQIREASQQIVPSTIQTSVSSRSISSDVDSIQDSLQSQEKSLRLLRLPATTRKEQPRLDFSLSTSQGTEAISTTRISTSQRLGSRQLIQQFPEERSRTGTVLGFTLPRFTPRAALPFIPITESKPKKRKKKKTGIASAEFIKPIAPAPSLVLGLPGMKEGVI